MSKLQDWTRVRNLDKGHIKSAIIQLRLCNSLTLREREIAQLCMDYLSGILSRWNICTPTSKREYLKKDN